MTHALHFPPETIMKKNITNLLTSEEHDRPSSLTLDKSKVHITIEIVEYEPHAVMIKTIIKKTTGNISIASFDTGEELSEKTSPFDNYVQIIDGMATLAINDKTYNLRLGEGIVIPAHTAHRFNANERFKMISTIIKSGYDD